MTRTRSPRLFAVCLVTIAAACGSSVATAELSTLRFTEVMSSSGTTGTPTADWWEVTNYGTSSIDMTGWKFDDSSFLFANSVALNGVTSIAAGESVLFLEVGAGGTAATNIANFRSFWGGAAATVQIGSYTGSGVGLSSAGDGVVLFDAGGAEVTPRATFGAATTGSSFYYAYSASGDPSTSPNSSAIVSTLGTLDGQVTFNSASTLPQNIGSPGTAINAVPEPSGIAFAMAGLGLAAAAGIRRGCLSRSRR